ncbi:importin-7 [Sparganum proliferum]
MSRTDSTPAVGTALLVPIGNERLKTSHHQLTEKANASECSRLRTVEADASDSDEDDDDFDADSVLEEFDTELDKDECKMDEYVTFYQLMTDMEQSHPGWYQQLVAPLSEAQKTEFKNIAETALKCIQQKQSKEIEKAGGYSFQQTDVPSSFDFSGNPPPGV